MKEGHIYTDDIIQDDYHKILKTAIASLPPDTEKIVHHISSPGGSVYGGYKGYHVLKGAGKPIKSIVEGEAQSMATFVALAGEEVVILNPSIWMIHNPSQGLKGDADALQGGAEELRMIEDEMAEAYLQSTIRRGKPKSIDQIKEMMKKETRMTAQEAVDFGFADSTHYKLKAVAIGKKMEDKEKTIFEKLEAMLGRLSPKADAPRAIDLPGADGNVYHVESETGDLVGKPITVNGAPAPDGTYALQDGRALVCAGGLVTEVKEAMSAEQQAAQKLAQENAALKAQMAQIEAAKTAAEAEKAKLATEAAQVATMLGTVKTEFETLKKTVIGNNAAPDTGMIAHRKPIGFSKTNKNDIGLMAARTFLADNMPWLDRHYGGKYSDGTRFDDYRTGGPCAVSILETSLNYDWNGILSTDLFFKPTIGTPSLSDVFTIDLGAASLKKYHIAPTANKVLKPYTGCDQAVTGTSLNITSKGIQLKPFQMYESLCKDDFTDQLIGKYNILAQEWLKTGNESFDPAGTPIDRMIVDLLKDSLRRDIWRRVSFGDTTSSSADWNQIDGFWQSLIDQSGASNYCVYRETSVTLGTGALAADAALDTFKAIFKNSSNLLKQFAIDSGNGEFLVTRSIWENYYDSLVDKGNVSSTEYENLLKGIGRLTYKGIPVVPITVWDDQLADATNPLAATTKHLVAFTVKDNHILGVEDSGDMEKIDSWFEKKDNKRYYRSNMTMGFLGAIHCDLTTIAY